MSEITTLPDDWIFKEIKFDGAAFFDLGKRLAARQERRVLKLFCMTVTLGKKDSRRMRQSIRKLLGTPHPQTRLHRGNH